MPTPATFPYLGAFYPGESYLGQSSIGMVREPSSIYQEPQYGVYIGGIYTPVVEAHTTHGVDVSIGAASIVVPMPLTANIAENAVLEIYVDNGGRYAGRIFQGVLRLSEAAYSDDGRWATITADGWAYLLAFKSEADVAFAGGANVAPETIQAAAVHIGDDTLAHYVDDVPNGTTVTIANLSAVASSFVLIEGRGHGTNSTNDDETLVMTVASRIEIWQNGSLRGSAPLPVIDEKWVEQTGEPPPPQVDFTVDAEWADFAVVVPVKTLAEDLIDVKFVSGTVSNGQRDEFEIKNVTMQMAVAVDPHEVVRGLARQRGFMGGGGPNYAGAHFVDVNNETILIGGNGLVDAGQIRVEKNTSWLDRITEISNLFGYRSFDCPDGKFRTRKYRGLPDVEIATTFTEGVDSFDLSYTRDTRPVVNFIEVVGASGNDNDGQAFEYRSVPDSIPANLNIPNPPGVAYQQISSDLLVSNDLCEQVREIAEIDLTDVYQEVSWRSYCRPWVHPAMAVMVDFPSLGLVETAFWIKEVRTDISDDGMLSTFVGWIGSGVALPGTDDCHYVPLRLTNDAVTRMYLTGDAPVYHPTTFRGAWNDATSGEEGALTVSPSPDLHRSTNVENSTSNTWDVLLGRFTSGPLPVAQTISGTVRFGAVLSQLAESANLVSRLHIFVTQGSTDTVRGTLLNQHEEDEEDGEWHESSRGLETNDLPLTSVAALAGDRVVFEMGYRAGNTVASDRWGRLHYGGRDLGDAKHMSTEKGSAWLEFSNLIPEGGQTHGNAIHIGDDTISWYVDTTPVGTSHSAYFQIAEDYTSITIHGQIHGVNSFLLSHHHAANETSRVELWQNGTKIGEGNLPIMARSQHDFASNDRYWSSFAVPITGQFEAGTVEVKFVAGVDIDDEDEEHEEHPDEPDDYEIKIASVEICGDRLPTLPDVPTTPQIPPPKPIPFGVTLLAYVPGTIVLDADSGDSTYPSTYLVANGVTIPAGTQYLRVSASASGLRVATYDLSTDLIESYLQPAMGVQWTAVIGAGQITRPWFQTNKSSPRAADGTQAVEFVWQTSVIGDLVDQNVGVVSLTPSDGGSTRVALSNVRVEAYGSLATPPYVHRYIVVPDNAPLYANRWTNYNTETDVRASSSSFYFVGNRSARDTSRKVRVHTSPWQLAGRVIINDVLATARVGLGEIPTGTLDYSIKLNGNGDFTLHTPAGSSTIALSSTLVLGQTYEWWINYKTTTGVVAAKIGRYPISTYGVLASRTLALSTPADKNRLYTCYIVDKNVNDTQEDVVLIGVIGPVIDLTLNASTFKS